MLLILGTCWTVYRRKKQWFFITQQLKTPQIPQFLVMLPDYVANHALFWSNFMSWITVFWWHISTLKKWWVTQFFSWEPALWTLMSVDRVTVLVSKKTIAIFGNKQWLLSLDMKTKVVQHVPRINLSHLNFQKFQIFKNFKFSNFSLFPAFVWLSDIFFYLNSNNITLSCEFRSHRLIDLVPS